MLKRTLSELEEGDPPPRREERSQRPTYLKIRLPNDYRVLLPDLLLLDVDRVEYVQCNGNTAQYLYKVLSILLDKPDEELQVFTTPSGSDAADDNTSWNSIPNDEQEYEGGSYLCRPCHATWMEKIVASTIRPSTPIPSSSSRPAIPATSLTYDSPGQLNVPMFPVPPMGPVSLMSTSPLAEIEALDNSMINLQKSDVIGTNSTVSKVAKPMKSNGPSSSFRGQLTRRDRKCVVSGVLHTATKASHLIPQHLISAMQHVGGVTTGSYTFTDPYDPRVGVLLCPDLDWHVGKFQAAFFVNNNDPAVFHLFRHSTLFCSDHFTPTALTMEGAATTINPDASMTEVLRWHYKHTLIRSWGGTSLIALIKDFHIAEFDEVAWSDDDLDCESQYSTDLDSD